MSSHTDAPTPADATSHTDALGPHVAERPFVYPRVRITATLTVLLVVLAGTAWVLAQGSASVPSPVDGSPVERSLINSGWLFVSFLASASVIPAAVKTGFDLRLSRRFRESR